MEESDEPATRRTGSAADRSSPKNGVGKRTKAAASSPNKALFLEQPQPLQTATNVNPSTQRMPAIQPLAAALAPKLIALPLPPHEVKVMRDAATNTEPIPEKLAPKLVQKYHKCYPCRRRVCANRDKYLDELPQDQRPTTSKNIAKFLQPKIPYTKNAPCPKCHAVYCDNCEKLHHCNK